MVKKILVIRIDGIGDLLCITPMLHTLRQVFPQATIDVLANLGPDSVLEGNPDFDRLLIDYRTKVLGSRWKGLRYLPIRLTRWLNWKFRSYDLMLVAHYGIHHRAIQIARSIRTKRIVVNVEPEHQLTLQDSLIEFVTFVPAKHEVEGVQAILNPWTTEHPGRMWLYPQSNEPTKKSPGSGSLHVGINLTSSCPQRLWPQENFLSLLNLLCEEFPDVGFIIMGNPADTCKFSSRLNALPDAGLGRAAVIHTPTLKDFIAAVAKCDLLISSDGGGVHIASALGVSQVSLFQNLPSKLVRWHPWAVPYKVIHANAEDAPVSEVTLEQVLAACRDQIQSALSNRATAAS